MTLHTIFGICMIDINADWRMVKGFIFGVVLRKYGADIRIAH